MSESPDHPQNGAPSYRAYFIGTNGHIEGAVHIQASDDVAAIAEARRLNHTREVELWERGRMVLRLEPNGGT